MPNDVYGRLKLVIKIIHSVRNKEHLRSGAVPWIKGPHITFGAFATNVCVNASISVCRVTGLVSIHVTQSVKHVTDGQI